MQKDFHFYAVYALSRCAGFNASQSFTIAYSSQHVDDAIYGHVINFENGGFFNQVRTSHKMLACYLKSTQYKIYLPFHFIPAIIGKSFYEKLITRPGDSNKPAQEILADSVSTIKKPYGLHRIGISLHAYADTWSHQGFSGVHRKENLAENLYVKGEDGGNIKKQVRGYQKDHFRESSWVKNFIWYWKGSPQIGHGEVDHYPDEPFRSWGYTDYKNSKQEINNLERCMAASEKIYDYLLKCASSTDTKSKIVKFSSIKTNLMNIFRSDGSIDDRVNLWKERIISGVFFHPEDSESTLSYNDREWFKKAVTPKEKNKLTKDPNKKFSFTRLEDFQNSDFKKFHDAARFHRFFILHEVLPKYGVFCD